MKKEALTIPSWGSNPLSLIADLCKARISAASAITAGAGAFIVEGVFAAAYIPVLLGVFFLACAACALNELQEIKIDQSMKRTASRPLPSGSLTVAKASVVVLTALLTGTLLLLWNGLTVCLLGLAAVVWYNGVYTPLKKITPLAMIPGAIIGAIPPAIGWLAAGGSISDPVILSLCLFLFLWQIPHFALLNMWRAEEYRHAGLPVLADLPMWTVRIWLSSMLLLTALAGWSAFYSIYPQFGIAHILIIAVAAAFLSWSNRLIYAPVSDSERNHWVPLFMSTNLFGLFIITALCLASIQSTT